MFFRNLFSSLLFLSACSIHAPASEPDSKIIQLIGQNKELGLSKRGLLKTIDFIETELPSLIQKKEYYFSKNRTGLPYAIEYDPENRACFILLEGKNAYLDRGKKKVVYKAINYKPNGSFLVARAEDCTKKARELNLTKKMHGFTGLFETYGFGRRKENSKLYSTIYARLYNSGSLERAFKNGLRLSNYEKMKVALNILSGLDALQQAGLVHRDLGAKNYLIDVPHGKPGKRDVKAVIADLGRTGYAEDAAGTRVQGNTSFTAPEGLYLDTLKGEDYYKTDVFAVGCVFYRLLYGPRAPWQDVSYVKDTRPLPVKYKTLVRRIKAATMPQRLKLTALSKRKKLSPIQQFEYLILQMLDTNPNKRPAARQLREKMEQIFAEAS